MRIWHQSMGSVQMNDVGGAIQKHAQAVCAPGTEVVVHGLPAPVEYVVSLESTRNGAAPPNVLTTIDIIGSAYLYHITLRQAIEAARQAEREGYDAFVIGSWTDPFLREMRSAVNIPVISTAEANLLLGCSFGKLQGLICLNPTVARVVKDRVQAYGLTERVVSIAALGDMDEWVIQQAWNQPEKIIARFTELAEQAIGLGADVIVPAEGIITEFFYAHGVTKIGKAPVFDTFGLAWKYAELLVQLRQKMKLTVGREWEYRQASDAQVTRVHQALGLGNP